MSTYAFGERNYLRRKFKILDLSALEQEFQLQELSISAKYILTDVSFASQHPQLNQPSYKFIHKNKKQSL
jgi:hypothetical protein